MLPRDSLILGEVSAFCEMTECLGECACPTELAEDKEGHEHDAKGLFTHKGGGGGKAGHTRDPKHGFHPKAHHAPKQAKREFKKEQRQQREEAIRRRVAKLDKHERHSVHVFHKAAEGLEGGQEVLDGAALMHGDVGEASGTIIDFVAMSIPHVKLAADKYRAHLHSRYGAHGARMIMAAGSAIALGIKAGVPGGGFLPLANYFGSIPALGIAEACRHAPGTCGKVDQGINAVLHAARKIPGVTPVAKGIGKAIGTYQKHRGKLERSARHVIEKGTGALGRGIGSLYRKIAGGQPAMAHAEGDDDPDGILDEPELDDATVQREAEKFAAYMLKTYKQLLDKHRPELEKASGIIAKAMQNKGAGNAPARP